MERIRKAHEVTAPATWPAVASAGRWVPLAQAVLLTAAGGYLFAPVLARLAHIWWTSDGNSFGVLVPLASLYFAGEKWGQLRTFSADPSPWAIPAAISAVAVFGFGVLGGLFGLQALGLVIYVSVVVLTVWGTGVWRALAFPLGFLAFVVPIPAVVLDRITYPLQLFAAGFAGWVLEALGIPVLIDRVYIHLPRIVLEVAVACAGLRYLASTTMMGVIVAYWGQRTIARRLLVATLAVPIAILANATRVATTGIVAHILGSDAAKGYFHALEGTIVFWVGIGGLIGVNAMIQRVWR